MTEKGKFKNADEFMEALDKSRIDVKESFDKHFGEGFVDDLGEETFDQLLPYIEMQVLSQYDDRKLALETFSRMDEGRRKDITDQLRKTVKGITEELGRRDNGILPEPGAYYADMSTEELKEWLGELNGFVGELRIIGMM